LLIDLCITDIIGTLLNIVNYETTRHSICSYVFLLSLTTWRNQRATRILLKKSRNFKKFKILEFKTRNIKSKNNQDKKNEIFYLENQDKTRNLVLMKHYSKFFGIESHSKNFTLKWDSIPKNLESISLWLKSLSLSGNSEAILLLWHFDQNLFKSR